MIEIDLYEALIKVCENTYPVLIPDNHSFPCITYQVVNERTNQATNGNLSSKDVRFQVDIFSKSYMEVKTLKDEVIAKVIGLGGGSISTQDLYEDDIKLHRQLIDFKIKRV